MRITQMSYPPTQKATPACPAFAEAPPCGAKAGPTKHVEEPRLRAVTHFGVQARALARGAPLFEKSL